MSNDAKQTTSQVADNTGIAALDSEVLAVWREIQERIAQACARCGRTPGEITLLGATKTVPAERLKAWLDLGLTEVGENYVQEGVAKKEALGTDARRLHWHLIGALQSNKAKIAVREFSLIHSVDRPSLAKALNAAAREQDKVQDVLLQVNVGGEATKAGCAPRELEDFARLCAGLENLRVGGLMCLPPYNEDAEQTRPHFRQLRQLRDDLLEKQLLQNGALSMGMSDNFEVAIEEGATIVRLGTILFGKR